MRWREIRENVSTTSGSIAPVSLPLGQLQRRTSPLPDLNKYIIKPRKYNAKRRP